MSLVWSPLKNGTNELCLPKKSGSLAVGSGSVPLEANLTIFQKYTEQGKRLWTNLQSPPPPKPSQTMKRAQHGGCDLGTNPASTAYQPWGLDEVSLSLKPQFLRL